MGGEGRGGSNWQNDASNRENQSTWRKTCSSATLSATNPTWTGLQGYRLVITRAILWPQVKVMIWEYDHQWCIGKDLKGDGYNLFHGPTLEKLRTISMRIITLAKM